MTPTNGYLHQVFVCSGTLEDVASNKPVLTKSDRGFSSLRPFGDCQSPCRRGNRLGRFGKATNRQLKKQQKAERTDLDSFFTLPVEFKAHPGPITKPMCFHLGHCRRPNFGDLVVFEKGVDFILRRLLPIFSRNVDGAY